MNNVRKVSLISKTYALNEIGVPEITETKTSVYAYKTSINQSEFYQSGLQGLQPYACYVVRLPEYHGEDEIEEGTKRLTVYRTYDRTDGRVELYTTERKGQR